MSLDWSSGRGGYDSRPWSRTSVRGRFLITYGRASWMRDRAASFRSAACGGNYLSAGGIGLRKQISTTRNAETTQLTGAWTEITTDPTHSGLQRFHSDILSREESIAERKYIVEISFYADGEIYILNRYLFLFCFNYNKFVCWHNTHRPRFILF